MSLLVALMAGLGLGTFFFYGLWRTLEKLITSKSPTLWLFSSTILRISITLIGFYLIASFNSDGYLSRLLICFFGFLVARFTISKVIQVPPKPNLLDKEANRAS